MKQGIRFLVVLFAMNFSGAFAGDFSPTGVGGGGWLHSGAFHPTNPDTILVGTDFAGGIYRTEDFGESWRPFNEGLQNDNEHDSNYVEDIVGVSYGVDTGFMAATYGGIYLRWEGSNIWSDTTPIDGYWYTLDTTQFVENSAESYVADNTYNYHIPFSCLEAVGTKVYAGAGRIRWDSSYETTFYPGIPNTAAYPFNGSPQSNTDQYTVWEFDFAGSQTWVPLGQCTFGAARDISAVEVGTQVYVTVATPEGMYLGSSLFSVGNPPAFALSSPLLTSS